VKPSDSEQAPPSRAPDGAKGRGRRKKQTGTRKSNKEKQNGNLGEADSFYALASLTYSAKLADAVSLGLSTSLGYAAADFNAFYFGVDEAALNDANFGVSLAWSLLPNLTVTPAYQYTLLVDSDIKDGAAGLYKDKDQSIVSLKATYTF